MVICVCNNELMMIEKLVMGCVMMKMMLKK
jgi:hypothetical protein